MNNDNIELHVKKLRYSDSIDEYNLYRAALEWDLIHPIVIQDQDDLKSEYLWKDRLSPFHHQIKNLITFCRRLPVTLLADDVWLWKTISAWLIMSELASRWRISKILIVCPKILMPQWQTELDTKFAIQSVIKTGQDLVSVKIPEWVTAVITTYNTARIHLDKLTQVGYDMLILDEAHKLRNLYGVDSPPQVATRFKKALEERMFKYVLMLTATPIQNRLWDLYSLVDLLTVARWHANPFGSPGLFAQKYIADKQSDARKLKQENQEEFRSVVYGYMSRIRRWDANLHFPERIVQLHNVDPTAQEMELIKIATDWIEKMNRLVQIGILQSLVSSPEALVSRLEHMFESRTINWDFLQKVKIAASYIPITTKLKWLGILINDLRNEKPQDWRVVIFTRFLDTQTSIQTYLESSGIRCWIINGKTWSSNQEMIAKFSKEHPEIHVIISTEAGSEWVNLQVANVLVNYDLPWNPMIVEQRIGRIQRLWSNHNNVCIFNIVLRNTFESYIVGRLMEKLQMASHAIGDIDSLLQASGVGDNDESGAEGFEENILKLVLASLAGKDVEIATQKKEKSIIDAKIQLEKEQENIDVMLGGMDDSNNNWPECPQLPPQNNSMNAKDFALTALESMGAFLIPHNNKYISELDGRKELIRFDNEWITRETATTSILYAPGSPAFDKLVWRITSKNLHRAQDVDVDPVINAEKLSKKWVEDFGWEFVSSQVTDVCRLFTGTALVRVRLTVAHDSYERLIEVECSTTNNFSNEGLAWLNSIRQEISNLSSIGLINQELIEASIQDPWILEFYRFYNERLKHELLETGNDERKRKKIEDDFTTRFEFSLLWLEGILYRKLRMNVSFKFKDSNINYKNVITAVPFKDNLQDLPTMSECQKTWKNVPEECLSICDISNLRVLKHLLVKSQISDRKSLPEYITECSVTWKMVLKDEVDICSISGKTICKNLLKKSVLSGRLAEYIYFDTCDFTHTEALKDELVISQVSWKKYRIDEELSSAISGKKGHKDEFVYCTITGHILLESESETCELTWNIVTTWLLQVCEVTGKKVIPSELEKSVVSGKLALRKYTIHSSISGVVLLESEAIKSMIGTFCTPDETKICLWSWLPYHPTDIKTCDLTGLNFYVKYLTSFNPYKLEVMANLLDWINRKTEGADIWEKIRLNAIPLFKNKNIKIESSQLSLDWKYLAVSLEIGSYFWLKVRYGGLIYSISDNVVVWKIFLWKRDKNNWIEEEL